MTRLLRESLSLTTIVCSVWAVIEMLPGVMGL
jgi:hypothetical protein